MSPVAQILLALTTWPKLVLSSWPSCPSLPSAGIIDMHTIPSLPEIILNIRNNALGELWGHTRTAFILFVYFTFLCIPSLVLNFHVSYSKNNPESVCGIHTASHGKTVLVLADKHLYHQPMQKKNNAPL